MADPFVVLVLVAAGAKSAPAISPMALSARTALGAGVAMLFEDRPLLPTEQQAAALAEHVRAGAIAEVDWNGPVPTHVVIYARAAGSTTWVERTIDFAPADSPDESGRTVGFALASMITGATPPDESGVAQPSATPVRNEARPPVSVGPSPHGAAPVTQRRTPASAPESRYAFDAVALVGAPPLREGAGATFSVSITAAWSVQAVGGVAFGALSDAQATLSSYQLGGGAAWTLSLLTRRSAFDLGFGADFLAADIAVQRFAATQSRWVPEARVAVNACWYVAPAVGVLLGGGAEATLGRTDIEVGHDIVATIPSFRAVATLGMRLRF